MSDIYARIRARREELGLSQEELASRMGYKSKSSINKIEMGINDIPQSKVVAFARALDTTTAYLMGCDDEKAAAPKDDGLNDYLEMLRSRPECRMLFSVAKDATRDDVEKAVAIIEALRKTEGKN